MKIDSIFILVHPGYFGLHHYPKIPFHVLETEFMEKWTRYLTENSSDSILICFLNIDWPYNLTNNENVHLHLATLDTWESILGEGRVFPIAKYTYPNKTDEQIKALIEILKVSEITNKVKLKAFGEFTERCVTNWGLGVKRLLESEFPNLNIEFEIVEELSIPEEQRLKILEEQTWINDNRLR